MKRLGVMAAFTLIAGGCLLGVPKDDCSDGSITCSAGAICVNGACVPISGTIGSTTAGPTIGSTTGAGCFGTSEACVSNDMCCSGNCSFYFCAPPAGTATDGSVGTTSTSAGPTDASATLGSTGGSSAGNGSTTGTTGSGSQCALCGDGDPCSDSAYACVDDLDGASYCALTIPDAGNAPCPSGQQRWFLPDEPAAGTVIDSVCYSNSGSCAQVGSGGSLPSPECAACHFDTDCSSPQVYSCVYDPGSKGPASDGGHGYCAQSYFDENEFPQACPFGEVIALAPNANIADDLDWVCYPSNMTCSGH